MFFPKLLLTAALATSIDHCIEGTSTDIPQKARLLIRSKSIPEALNYFYKSLMDEVGSERCKKYAAVLSTTAKNGLLYESTIEQLLSVPPDIIDKHYERMGPKRVSALFMSAVDKYRTSQLAPPVLDLIECLKQINDPMVEKYLNNDQLKTIIYLYQQALKSPMKKINLDIFDLTRFDIWFIENLRTMMKTHLEDGINSTSHVQSSGVTDARISSLGHNLSTTIDLSIDGPVSSSAQQEQRPIALARQRFQTNQKKEHRRILRVLQAEQLSPPEMDSSEPAATSISGSETNRLAETRRRLGRPPVTDARELEARRQRKRTRERNRARKRRQEDPFRYREQERLRKQRQRLLKPPELSKLERESQQRAQRRRREKQRAQRQERQRQRYEAEKERLRSLERQMVESHLQQVQQLEQRQDQSQSQPQQQEGEQGVELNIAGHLPPNIWWSGLGPVPQLAALPAPFAPNQPPQKLLQQIHNEQQEQLQVQQQQQEQQQRLSMPHHQVSACDKLFPRPGSATTQQLLDSPPHSIPLTDEDEWQHHLQQPWQQVIQQLLSPQSTPDTHLPIILGAQMQWRVKCPVVKPTVHLPARTLVPDVHPQFGPSSSSVAYGQNVVGQNQAMLRSCDIGSQPGDITQALLSLSPQEQGLAANDSHDLAGQSDDLQFVDIERILGRSDDLR